MFEKVFCDSDRFGSNKWDVFGTAQIGYDRTFNKRILIGAFADNYFSKNNDESIHSSLWDHWKKFGSVDGNVDLRNVWNVGGRIGFLVTPRLLIYGDGGYSHADLDGSINVDFKGKGAPTLPLAVEDMDGYFVGGGAEVKIARNVSLKFEYRWTQLGDESAFASDSISHSWKKYCEKYTLTKDYEAASNIDANIQSVRADLILKFGEPEHTVAALK